MRIIIDDKPYEAQPGQYVLEIARQNGVEIPALCHHEALQGQACCRLCVVEAEAAEGSSIVVSCTYPAKEGLRVNTRSVRVTRLRRAILALLKEQAPEAEGKLPEYCAEYGVSDYALQYNEKPEEKCILCGLCSKACEKLGSFAIQTTMRGIDRVVAPPFNEPSEACIGCASCKKVCPTGAIESIEDLGAQTDGPNAVHPTRTIWGKTFELIQCAACGKPFATKEELEWLKERLTKDTDLNQEYCPKCRGRESTNK